MTGDDNRLFVEAVLWVVRTGAPWRDLRVGGGGQLEQHLPALLALVAGGGVGESLPAEAGNWNSTFRRFSRWSRAGVWESLFKALADDPDFEYVMLDSTIVRAHQHSAGAKGGLEIRPSGARAGG